MRALRCKEKKLQFSTDYREPKPCEGEALIRTRLAGICNTDIEILRGYYGFQGVLGHEFAGEVIKCDSWPELVGKRVVGEINAYCGECETCLGGDPTHCPYRTTLGIDKRDGVMADYFTLPANVLYEIPDSLPDELAVFTEPLAAACEITHQHHIKPADRVVLLGDGKLGQLVAQVVQLTGCDLTVIGMNESKLALLDDRGIRVALASEEVSGGADLVIEATGDATGFRRARQLVHPRGKIILKSTFHGKSDIDCSMIVVDELTVSGSRCGPFEAALRLLQSGLVDPQPLIHDRYSLDESIAAFERATQPGALKVLIEA